MGVRWLNALSVTSGRQYIIRHNFLISLFKTIHHYNKTSIRRSHHPICYIIIKLYLNIENVEMKGFYL